MTVNIAPKTHVMIDQGDGTYKTTEPESPLDEWQLAEGHYAEQKYAMTVVTPRPDAETGLFSATTARHRWAYYDGVNPIRYEFAVKVFGGAAPHIFELVSAPVGMTVGNDRTPASHGVIKWTPASAFSTESPASVTLRIYGQDGASIDVSWTIATSSSTDKFMFMSESGNDSTGNGSISSPFATLQKFMGAASTNVTYPNRIVYMRGGDYATAAHTDAWNGGNASETIKSRIQLVKSNHPVCYLAYPGENVNVDFSDGEILTDGPDFYLSGSSNSRLTILGSANNAAETHNIWIDESSRGNINWVTFDGFIPRVAGNYTNSAPMFSPNGTRANRRYWGLHDVREINRTQSSANDGLLHVFFATEYWVEDWCSGTRVGTGTAWKDTNFFTSSRYGFWNAGASAGLGFAFMGQGGSGSNEVLFTRVIGALWFNFQANGTVAGLHAARCSVYTTNTDYQQAIRAWTGVGPFTADNCAAASNGAAIISSLITSTGNEAQAANSSGNLPFNTSTLELVNAATQYRTLYLGTRGWEIQ